MEWVRGRRIGHGSFAAVSLAKPTTRSSNLPPVMAVKTCSISHSVSLENERMILEELKDCPEIITCFGDSVTVENGQRFYNVALEYASGGALSEKVKNLSENEIRRFTNSILKGLSFIHRSGFVHCDIKLQNVLLFSGKGNSKETVKIADFGLAKRVQETAKKYEIRGTPMYMAPETVIGGEQEPASDIWALGCLVTEMITGNPVWNCSDVGGLLMKIGVGGEIPAIPGKLSDAGKDFIGKCFLKDPRKRWTAEMLLNHPFVNDLEVEEAEDQISPRDPFGFPDWESEMGSSPEFESRVVRTGTEEFRLPEILPAARLGDLLTGQKVPNWSVSDSWVKVR